MRILISKITNVCIDNVCTLWCNSIIDPEGWYSENILSVAGELLNNEDDYKNFLEELDKARKEKRMQKIDEKYERQRKIIGFFRYIFYSPLQIMFSTISLISRCLACILSLPLIYFIGRLIYLLYKGNGVLISDIINTLIFIGLPFLMFFIQELSDKISFYFRMNKY